MPRFVLRLPPVGPLCSAGITPLHRYYEPVRQALVFAVLRLSARTATLLPRAFSAGRGALPCFYPCPCVRAAALYPAERRARRSVSGAPAAFAVIVPAQRSDLQMTGPRPDVHASLRPVTLAHPAERGFVGGLRRRDLPRRRHPSYAASISTASGLSPYGSTGTSRHHTTISAGQDQQESPTTWRRSVVVVGRLVAVKDVSAGAPAGA